MLSADRPIRFAAAVLAGLVCCAAPAARADEIVPVSAPPRAIAGVIEYTGRLLVRPWPMADLVARGMDEKGAQAADRRARARLDADLIRRIGETDEYLVRVAVGVDDADAAGALLATGDYQYAHPDYLCYPAASPNDPGFGAQYQHTRLQSGLAWRTTTGLPSVIVALVDSGIDLSHPDFAGRLVSGYNAPDALPQSSGGAVNDLNGHGTSVAGCAAAAGNNGVGVAGVGWNLSIMPVRASNLQSGAAPLSTITAGARWAADHGARVVSVSFTGVTNPSVQTTGAYVRGAGGLLLWAAGNSGVVLTPGADWPDVTIVGALDPNDLRAGYSNSGAPLDCVAPGTDVLTTTLGGGIGPVTGTSFATPIAAGVAGLIFSANPALTPAQAEAVLLQACVDLGAPGEDPDYGAGVVNAYRAARIAAAGTDPPIPAPDSAAAVQGVPIILDVLANDTDPLARPITIAAFDATTALGGSVVRSMGTGPGGRDELVFTPGGPGDDGFEYTAANGVGLTTVQVNVRVHSAGALMPGAAFCGNTPGLRVAYYDLSAPLVIPNFAGVAAAGTSVWGQVDFPLSSSDFADSLRSANFGAVATGYLTVTTGGFYTLGLESSDGSRLLLDGQEIVVNDQLHGPRRASGLVGLAPGPHAVRIEFFQRAQSHQLIARIAGPGMAEQVIPASMLTFAAPFVVDVNADGHINPDDLSDFITRFFAGDGGADFNGDGALDPDDLADYITAFFGS